MAGWHQGIFSWSALIIQLVRYLIEHEQPILAKVRQGQVKHCVKGLNYIQMEFIQDNTEVIVYTESSSLNLKL